MILDYITTESEIGMVVKLRHSQASKMLGRDFMATDLITIVKPEHMGDFERDFAIYLQLEEKDRTAFIERLKTTVRYTGGWLSEDMIPGRQSATQDLFAA
jgi:hypothetical protein